MNTLAVLLFTLAAAPSPTVDEIVARHIAARGGREALKALRTVRMTGRAVAGPGQEAIVRREIANPDRIRTEFEFQGTTGVYVWNGNSGWRVSPLDGQLEPGPLPVEEAAMAAEQADLEGPLVDWRKKGHKVELVGSSALPGGPAHELKVTTKSGAIRRVFVDAATGLVVRTEANRRVRGHEVALETVFGDYRASGGVQFPHTLEMSARNRPRRVRIVVEKVETNVPLEASRFQMPR